MAGEKWGLYLKELIKDKKSSKELGLNIGRTPKDSLEYYRLIKLKAKLDSKIAKKCANLDVTRTLLCDHIMIGYTVWNTYVHICIRPGCQLRSSHVCSFILCKDKEQIIKSEYERLFESEIIDKHSFCDIDRAYAIKLYQKAIKYTGENANSEDVMEKMFEFLNDDKKRFVRLRR